MGASSWAGWKPVPVLGSPGPVGRGCNLAPQRPGPRLPPQSRTMAAPIGHASLDTSPITLYLCFTLLFFFLSYYCLTLGEAKDIIYSSLLYQICVKHLIKRCFHTARDISVSYS